MVAKYPNALYNSSKYCTTRYYISEKNVEGEKISTLTLSGYDKENNLHRENADIYKIKDLSEKIAIAFKFAEDNHFYVYANTKYSPTNLNELLKDVNFENNVTTGSVQIWKSRNTSEEEFVSHVIKADKNFITKTLFADKSVTSVDRKVSSEKQAEIYFNVDVANMHGVITVYDNGYFGINFAQMFKEPNSSFNDSEIVFFVGKEITDKFFDYISKNAAKSAAQTSQAFSPR